MKVSDEALIAALIKYGSHQKAAAELGITNNSITNRLKRDDFRKRYEAAKSALLQEAVDSMKVQLKGAVSTLVAVMNNKENPPTVRVSAADSLLRHAVRYIEVAEIENRISKLELDRGVDNEEL